MGLQRIFGRSRSAAGTDLEPLEAHRRQAAGAVLVDVREPAEWVSGHAAGARHIRLGDLTRQLGELPTDRDVLFICQSGSRSGVATQLARRYGLERAHNVSGGTSAWIRAGLPLEPRSVSRAR